MRTEERVETAPATAVRRQEPQSSVIFSEAFAQRRKQNEYQQAVNQITERAKKLDW